MPPDSKDILFNGLETELGSEAEPIKAWIMERISSDAQKKQKKSQEQETDDSLPTIPGRKKSEWQPDCNPQKTVVTGSSSGAVKRKPASTDQPDLKKTKQQSNKKKVWPKEIQRRYDTETDPKVRRLLKEIGKDLDEWLTEEEVEETLRLFFQGPDGQRELLRRWHAELKEEARKQGETLGDEEMKRFEKMQEKYKTQSLQSLASKYRDSKPFKADTLWWHQLRYVACIMLQNEEQKVSPGLYSMNMALEGDSREKLHVVGFEDHNEALNFCRTLVPEINKLGGATGARVIPFEPKELLREASESGFQVTVLKKGHVENYAGKPLEEVEYRILEIGRDVYVQEKLRERSIDVKSMMKDLWSDDF
ncbi:uncharacterized protein LOC112350169 isoform X2 [Selaginella moellendorffii]|uniref:uncharacterized protein LOC112350169 isoform X2 n=1 Tax=Selaginella moellendorffii TaxID=88036 RepID=UPI000D1C62C0|nr:uncharacterized protein LOC112350169 isoform X2 [Selaginella moellendorffii]|eukprot:XP_024541683.1 uncharacterized protein LOC112350169 isoform X2 [Selaginella moellendorffii]